MKLKCERKGLYEAVQIVETVTTSATTKPILQDIKITAGNGYLELSATDLEVGVRYFVRDGISILNQGTVVVPGAKIGSILREWTEDEVELAVEENICHLQGKDSYFKLFCSDEEMFPTIPDFVEETASDEEKPFTINSDVLSEMIKKTSYAVATERVNQVLTGVLLKADGNKIIMIATDGRRLARVERDLEEPVAAPMNGIVPIKGLSHLLKVMSAGDSSPVNIQLKETYLIARTKSAVVSCRLMEGQYPNVEDIIPEDNDKKLEIETKRFLSAVKRASLLTSDECRVIRLRLEPGKLTLSSEAAELGEAHIELDIGYSGEQLDIGFNPDFIIDALKVIAKEEIVVALKQPNAAGVIKGEQGYLSLIMPVNLLQE